jgi:hypothetical protein
MLFGVGFRVLEGGDLGECGEVWGVFHSGLLGSVLCDCVLWLLCCLGCVVCLCEVL